MENADATGAKTMTTYHIDIFAAQLSKTSDIKIYGPHQEGGEWKTAVRMGRPAARQYPEHKPVCVAATMEEAEEIVAALNAK